MTALHSPLRLIPTFRPAPWGGRALAALFPAAPPTGLIGEAWIAGDFAGYSSAVVGGGTLGDAIRSDPAAFWGRDLGRYDGFPLLLKFLDVRGELSVQVHPDDARAQTLAGFPRGKTEAWLVTVADPGSTLLAGLKPGVDAVALRAALAAGCVADCLHEFAPHPGDCLPVPAGLVHAARGGVVFFEVQQACDITYRLHDWGRTDRELHVEQALACIDFTLGPASPVRFDGEHERLPDGAKRLVASPYFTLLQRSVNGEAAVGEPGRCSAVVVLTGVVALADDVLLRAGDCVVLPAACGPVEVMGTAVVAECRLPA